MNEFEKSPAAHFTRPWPLRRGVEPSDKGHDVLLILAAPADVTAAFARHGARVVPDALGREVTIGHAIGVVVRLRGHEWTHVLCGGQGARVVLPGANDLSRDLGVPVLHVASWEEDIEYRYFERGDEIEHMTGTFDSIATFTSRRRARESLVERSGFDAADAFAKELGAYVSDLQVEYFFSDGRTLPYLAAGSRMRVGNPGTILVGREGETVSRPELEKLDYIVLAP